MRKAANIRNYNIILFSVYSIISSFVLTRGIFLLYLVSRGMSVVEVAFYQTLYFLSVSILEIPTGYLGDKYGKKKALLIGNLLLIIHTILMIVNKTFIAFAMLAILEALAYTFLSGSDNALLYELLESEAMESKYLKVNSFLMFGKSIMTGLGILIGSLIAKSSWDLVYISTTVIFILGISILPFIKDKHIKTQVVKNPCFLLKKKNFLNNITYRLPVLFAIFFICSSLGDGFFMSYYNFNQVILKELGISVTMIGIFFSILYFLNAFAYLLVNFLTKLFQRKVIFVFVLIGEAVSFFVLSCVNNPFIVMVLSAVICFLPEMLYLISDSIIQQYINADYRATILSMVSLISSIVSALAYATLGITFELINLKVAIFSIGILIGIASIISIKVVRRINNNERNI